MIDWSIFAHFVYEISENIEEIFKLLVLSNQQAKACKMAQNREKQQIFQLDHL